MLNCMMRDEYIVYRMIVEKRGEKEREEEKQEEEKRKQNYVVIQCHVRDN